MGEHQHAAIALHVPCVRCQYDLFGQRRTGTCPECGVAAESSLNPKRLLFAEETLLVRLYMSIILGLAYHVCSVMVLFLGGLLRASFDSQEVLRSSCNVLGAVALIAMSAAWIRERASFASIALACLLGSATLLTTVIMLAQCQCWLDLAPRSADSVVRRILLFARHRWDPPAWFQTTTVIVAVSAYHLMLQQYIARLPCKRWSRVLLATVGMILFTGIAVTTCPDGYSGTWVATVIVLLAFVSWVASAGCIAASLRLVRKLVRQRQALHTSARPPVGL